MQDIALAIPQEIEQTGIRRGLLEDLALKTLYLNGEMSLRELSDRMCLGLGVIEEIFRFLSEATALRSKRHGRRKPSHYGHIARKVTSN